MAEETELKEEVRKSIPLEKMHCPFPGLRPFKYSETHLYFGQDIITERVISQLIEHRFVAVLGGAGVGKTSFISCGLKPYFFTGIVGSSNTKWHIIHTRPSGNPIRNLADAITKLNEANVLNEGVLIQSHINYNVLKRGKSGLIELIKQYKPAKEDKFLIVVDQFEDIFRFRNTKNEPGIADDAFEYVNILIHAIQQQQLSVYLTLVVRSDFADDCLMFPNLSDYINRSNVLVPRLTRDQIREVVTAPLEASQMSIDRNLVLQILNDASNSDDLLPRLQHAMRRAWESWKVLGSFDKPLSLTEYEIAGGLKSAINNHANELYATLSDNDKVLCEKIFRSLAEKGLENKGFSRPTSVKELCGITQAGIDDVIRVIDVFRNPAVGFLLPDDEELSPETVVDLVHSSLLRTWYLMKTWVQDENISSQMYRQISDASAQYQVGKTGLLRPPDLQFALNWLEKQKPTLEWAKRYNPAFERTMVYIRTSQETFAAEEAFKKLQAKKALRKVRSLTVILGSTAILALILTIYSQVMRRQDSIKLKQVSEQQVHLEQKSVEAERESQEYLMEKRQAEIAALEALKQKEEAVSATKVLSEQKTQAELTAQEALQEKSKFQENLQKITIQKQLAEKNAIQEAQQRNAAEKEREEVFKRRMQNMGQTLAVKSLQSNNSTLKGLLALHSYVFNTKFGNSIVNPDVYNALFTAVKDAKGTTQYGLKGHAGTVRAFALQPRSNVLYSTGVDGKVLRWVVTDDVRPPQTVFQATGGNSSMVISNNGRYLAVGSESGNIYLLNLSSPGAPVTLKGHQGAVFSMAFTPDGQQLISSGSDKKIFLWDLENNSKTPIYQEPVSVRAISISPDGKFLAGGSDNGRIFLWDIKGNQFADLPSEDNTPIHSIAFSPNGLTLATGDLSGRVKFWNPYSHKLVRALQPHSGRVTQIVFSSSGEMVASSSYDKSVAIFDNKFISTVPLVIKENSLVFSLIFTNDSKRLITALNSADFVNVWPAQARVLAEQLCSKVTRALTQDEWNSFIGSDIKYEKPCE